MNLYHSQQADSRVETEEDENDPNPYCAFSGLSFHDAIPLQASGTVLEGRRNKKKLKGTKMVVPGLVFVLFDFLCYQLNGVRQIKRNLLFIDLDRVSSFKSSTTVN
jgi:hypothetical protein